MIFDSYMILFTDLNLFIFIETHKQVKLITTNIKPFILCLKIECKNDPSIMNDIK